MHRILTAAILVLALPHGASAQGKSFTLVIDEELEATGLISFLTPRFALKHGIRPNVVAEDPTQPTAGTDALIGLRAVLTDVPGTSGQRPVFYIEDNPDQSYAIALLPDGPNAAHAEIFRAWLTGEIGQRTVASFAAGPSFVPGALKVAAPPPPEPTGDANEGERLSLFHCGRCHVVNEKNRMGGIGSTPSFAALRAIPGWRDKFLAFWSANPHPSFTQVEGLTEPFDPDHPPHIAPVEITQSDIEAIFAYASTIEPKDLGAPISQR